MNFTETKEMIDATIYENGNGEITAQNVNLAMQGIVSAAEDGLAETNKNVESVSKDVAEINKMIEQGGIGGLELQFPMGILSEVLGATTADEFYMDREKAAEIIAEYPSLAAPIEKMFQHNAEAIGRYYAAIEAGQSAPVINVNLFPLIAEFAEAEGLESAGLVSNLFAVGTFVQDSLFGVPILLVGIQMDNLFASLAFMNDGTCGAFSFDEYYMIDIPRPNAVADNSFALNALNNMSYYSSNMVRQDFRYDDTDAIVPVHIKTSPLGSNLLIRFVVDTDLLEAVINLQTGMTTSRIIAKMNAEEVDVIAEGNLERIHDLTYEYYEVLPADGGVVSLKVKSTAAWKLYNHEALLKEGEAGETTYTYVAGANTTGEVYNHNFRLVSAADGEEFATLWVKQDAATEVINEE